jgi:putative oxidoreductase
MSKGSDFGLLLIRVGVGAVCVAHGAQKLFGSFGGYGIKGTGGWFESVGFVPGERNAIASGLSEAGGGALLALGLASGPAGAAIAGNMAVASSTHTGFFNTSGGYELPATFGLVGAAVALGGPGRFSLDALTGDALNKPWMRGFALVSAAAAAAYLVSERAKVLAARGDDTAAEDTGDPHATDA